MRRWAVILLLFAGAAGALSAGERREIQKSFTLEDGQRLVLEFPVGSLRVEGGGGDRVEVEIDAECRWGSRSCEKRLERLRLRSDSTSRRLRVEVDADGSWGGSKLELEAVVRAPRGADLEIEMGVGELEVEGFRNDLKIDLGVGEVEVWAAESSVRSVSLDAGIGEARLRGTRRRVEERRSLLIGGEVFWDEGEGDADLEIEVGVGEVTVRLD